MKRVLSYILFLSLLAGVGYWNVCEYRNLTANRESLARMQMLVDFSKFEGRVKALGSFRSQQMKFSEPYYNYLIHSSAEDFFAGFSDHFVVFHPPKWYRVVRPRTGSLRSINQLLRFHPEVQDARLPGYFLLYVPPGDHQLGVRVVPYCDPEQTDDVDWDSGICREFPLKSSSSCSVHLGPNENDRLELRMTGEEPVVFPVRLKKGAKFLAIETDQSIQSFDKRLSYASRFLPAQLSRSFFLAAERGILNEPTQEVVISERMYKLEKTNVMVQIYVRSDSPPVCEAHDFFALQTQLYLLENEKDSWVFDCLRYDQEKQLYVYQSPVPTDNGFSRHLEKPEGESP